MAHTITDEELFCLQNCGSYKQYYTMRKRFEGECGFCHLDTNLNNPLYEDDFWILWENAFANNRPCKTMLVIITKEHLRSLGDISREAWNSFYDLLQWTEKQYRLPGGMLFMRFGDIRLNAGTVPHLHWNLWVPDGTKELRVPIFKDPSHTEENALRAFGFSERYDAGEIPK